MTNYEAYKDEIIAHLGEDDCDELYRIALAANNRDCDDEFLTCAECRKIATRWLTEEYKEPTVDWSNVAVDTPVLVSKDGIQWIRRYFAKYEDDAVWTWTKGATSWTANDVVTVWDYAKLYREME